MIDVATATHPIQRFLPIVGKTRFAAFQKLARTARSRLAHRVVWNVNSTPAGGGVAEILNALLPYVRGVGIDTRWAVIEAPAEFFRITKRLHHALHGSPGDGSDLGNAARAIYERAMHANAVELVRRLRPQDIVLLHDPQTAGLAPHLIRTGAIVIWRCHIGRDRTDAEVEKGWAFLNPYLCDVPVFVFSRAAYVPPSCDHGRSLIISPSIDAFSPKNQNLDDATVRAILVQVGLVEGPPGGGMPVFRSEDGSVRQVERAADVIRLGRAPAWSTPLVVQVSRWDPLKDPIGVIRGFTELLLRRPPADVHLVLAGPGVTGVADDPEGSHVLLQTIDAWRQLPRAVRRRVHLACLPMADVEENAATVNALQRHATVVVQKSLEEGFGLTVTEAMWKARPIVASAVGGIQDQIVDGVTGLLLKNPTDHAAFAAAVHRLLEDSAYARTLGENARAVVAEKFLGFSELARYAALINRLDRLRRHPIRRAKSRPAGHTP